MFPEIWVGGYWPDLIVQLHLSYLAIAKLFTWLPVGTLAYRVNLVSAFFGAVTVANAFAFVRLMTGSRWPAALAVLSLALGQTFWAHSVMAECLTMVTATLTAELLALLVFAQTRRARWIMLGAFINGVGLSNHMLAALATPVYVVLVLIWWHRKRVFGWHVLACLGLWFLGASPYLVVVVRAIAITGEPARIIRSATTGGWPAANLSISTSLLAKSAAWILIQYPTLLVIAGIFGIWVKPPQSSLRLVKGAVVAVLPALLRRDHASHRSWHVEGDRPVSLGAVGGPCPRAQPGRVQRGFPFDHAEAAARSLRRRDRLPGSLPDLLLALEER
jgi:hypothetical protein